jgi:hypothetical protein
MRWLPGRARGAVDGRSACFNLAGRHLYSQQYFVNIPDSCRTHEAPSAFTQKTPKCPCAPAQPSGSEGPFVTLPLGGGIVAPRRLSYIYVNNWKCGCSTVRRTLWAAEHAS